MALIQESARSNIPLKDFIREYKKAEGELHPSSIYEDQRELKRDFLTIAIVNTYEAYRASKE